MRFGGCHGGDPFPYASPNWRRYQRRCAIAALVIDHPLDNFFAQTALRRSYGVRCAAAVASYGAVAESALTRARASSIFLFAFCTPSSYAERARASGRE